ncbi:hypothetical protein [Desulfitobacterium metallireducens]|uniref:Uncharacterized protein n=1 Tax=Desulfitobacterium metallireducens DSM 15288 TaxID=871968 RepID=W0EA78_9FIRM|nr:hypothetical protein [Desulfitobacterium metallireducens]AHF07755.1 hypothetical protein DESME_12535 [Desulfitobacterium metallireducens DSM 15288]
MYSLFPSPNQSKRKSGVVLPFKPKLAKKQPKPCIFCGDTLHLQTFKGQIVCSACLQDIPTLFVCG